MTLGGASNGAQSLGGNITISNSAGTTALTVIDSTDTKAQTAFLSDGQLANIEPYLIQFGSANLSSLTIEGSNTLGTLNVNAGDQGPVSVAGGSTTGSGTISIGSNAADRLFELPGREHRRRGRPADDAGEPDRDHFDERRAD